MIEAADSNAWIEGADSMHKFNARIQRMDSIRSIIALTQRHCGKD
jgi:hypothetical protein